MYTENEIALFDDYISSHLSQEEGNVFEKRLEKEPGLKAKFERYKKEYGELKKAGELHDFRKQIKTIHSELFPKKKSILLHPKFYIPLSLVAILVVGFFIVNPKYDLSKDNASADYNELAYTIEESVSSEEDNVSNYQATEMEYFKDATDSIETSLLEIVNTQPKGTAFLIDLNGYFLTSKHLTNGRTEIVLQQRENNTAFLATVIYEDSLLDFALLKANTNAFIEFQKIPYRVANNAAELGDEVFTLGYTKNEIVYTKGAVSSLSGYKSNKNYIEISMPANAGNSGAPLFSESGEIIGIITANNSKKQAVTYVLNHVILREKLNALQNETLTFAFGAKTMKRYKKRKEMIHDFQPYLFEVH